MKTLGYILMENGEKIDLEFFPEEAPKTVENFKKLAEQGFYDGVTFHRVIPGFVSQGGDPTGTGAGGPGYSIPCETDGNPHRHLVGSLSMAHAGRNTGGSQFFVVHEPQPHLDGVHTVFGKATSGIEAVLNMRQGDVMKEVKVWEE
ncbi:TPA: peptidylprolyl isomerase [Bacillus thuringiensis]|uniref:Peptidyl-prolyl cis-trans isomerase n=1 Tax=Bacillus cereus TaxID=1396 RepID=A0A9X6ZBG8_BACCE|nr:MULTISPECIES: peptidylprolyl isomerase [Bacillus cereus group]MCH4567752.1 peptidylprolyl isomerase [Bacillus sp. ES1-5]HDR6314202.1 peptidylprolyl isomerase [Bacillus thuringiensis]MCU5377464.1 peptidylprolyl isomerase [Bacillus cereus]MED1380371.1 peptidylprolyl isomerase [Bacillus mycoides]PFB26942.1 peptidylprolyl isomerase [Bacillus cereus]